METLKEDVLEEEEFRSLSTFEQQRFMKSSQDMDKEFKEIQTDLKQKCKARKLLDFQALNDHKERFDDHMRYWDSKLLSWDIKYEEKKKLSGRLKKEAEIHEQMYLNIYTKIKKHD